MEVFSAQPDAPVLELGGFFPGLDPVQVRNIEGLGPVKAAIMTTQFASGKGEFFQGSQVGKRNIIMSLGLNPEWATQTMASLRHQLYRYLLPEAWCKLRFFSDEFPTVDIEGYVESFEPNMFTQDPEVQISVICPKPDFIEPDATIYYGVVDDGTIEFEFEYLGNVPAGLELRIAQSVDNVSYIGPLHISLQQEPNPAEVFTVDPVKIDGTQYFKLSTSPSAKRVSTLSNMDGTETNLLWYVSRDSSWPLIRPGKNLFKVAANEDGQAWTMAFFNRFGGL